MVLEIVNRLGPAFGTLLLGVCLVRSFYFIRGRAMRAFAAKTGFEYIGPETPPNWLRNPDHLHIQPPLPGWISHLHPGERRIRQVWNVMEGKINGISVLIFDCIIGEFKTAPCTILAAQTEHDVFGVGAPVDSAFQSRITQSHGWTVVHGTWFMWFSWTMGTKRIDNRLNQLRGAPISH